MRWLLTWVLLLALPTVRAQTQSPPQSESQSAPAELTGTDDTSSSSLPDSPGAAQVKQQDVVTLAEASFKVTGNGHPTCGFFNSMKVVYFDPNRPSDVHKPCIELIYPYQRFLTSNVIIPLTWQQKGFFALHEFTDPANLGTIVGISAITIGTDSHTAYGPGFKGFGKIVGVTLLQDATGQFFGVFAIPSIVHQDPRYFRMPQASIPRRILYSISRTVISRNDHGTSIPNYATLLTYPIATEISNLYVPGINTNGPSTVARIATGLALDPANNLLTEFLPDVASRIHVRIIFVQTLLNNIASTQFGGVP
jgi:hypothetical protein